MPDLILDCGSAATFEAIAPAELVAAGVKGVQPYTGGGRPSLTWLEDVMAAGVGVRWTQERNNEWAQGGADAARQDLDFAESRMYGAPNNVTCSFATSDDSAASPGPGDGGSWPDAFAGLVAYGAYLGANSPRDIIDLYGNTWTIDAVRQGISHARARPVTTWLPCFWGPADTDDVWQYGYQRGVPAPAPFDGVDSDYVMVGTIADLGFWGLTGTAPQPKGTPSMFVLNKCNNALEYQFATVLTDGGVVVRNFTGPAGAFGVPQSAIDFIAKNPTVPVLNMVPAEWGAIDQRTAASLVTPATVGGDGVPAFDFSPLRAKLGELAALLPG